MRRRSAAAWMMLASGLAFTVARPAAADPANAQEFQRRLAKGLLLANTGRKAEAILLLRRAHNLFPDRTDVLIAVASLEAGLGNDAGAERLFKKILRERPNATDAMRELGAFYLERDRDLEALGLLERACAQRPGDGSAHYYRGVALAEVGREEPAREAFGEALRLRPELASRIHYELAHGFERAGDLAGARASMSSAIAASTDDDTVRLAKAELATIGLRKTAERKIWSLFTRVTTEADSNPSLLADPSGAVPGSGSTLGADTSPTREAFRTSLDLSLSIVPIEGRHTLDFGFGFAQTKHLPAAWSGGFVPPTLDQTVASAYVSYAFQTRAGAMPMRLEVAAGHSVVWLDVFGAARHYLENAWARPSVVFTYRPWGELRVAYRFGLEEYATGNKENSADDRDGLQHLVALENTFFLGSNAIVRATAFGAYYGADGRRWSAVLAGGALDGQVKPMRWLQLSAGFAALRRDYSVSDYTRTFSNGRIETVRRSDQSYFAFARVGFPRLVPSVSLFYSYSRNDSTLPETFDFRRHLGGVDLQYAF